MKRLLLVSTLVALMLVMLAMSAGSALAYYQGSPQDKNARHAEPDFVPHFGGCAYTSQGAHGPTNTIC